MSISELIDRVNNEVCPKCTDKCKGCDCNVVSRVMKMAESGKLSEEERRKYMDFMKG